MIGLKRIENESLQTLAQQKSEKVVGIMPGRFEPDSYLGVIETCDFGVEFLKALVIVGDGQGTAQNLAVDGLNEAVVLVLCNVNADQNHENQALSRKFDVA